MPDFDVQALSLASPPSAAPVTTYRPAVRVRNNGIHPADITGNLRIYRREPPGELLATHQLSLLNLGAGLEGDALSSGYWTPTAADVGREFLFTAHVDTDHDQNTGNNDLSPVTVIVTAGEPPPPPGVLAHATQHEAGGADQVEITGLHGLTADAQTALAHKATHQAGGPDALNVDGLMGTLAEGQPIADHHESHEDGGGDKLYVGGLRGQLADNQPSIVHDNAKHDPNYTTVTEHNNHLTDTTAVHAVATNLEQTANKGTASGYAGLGANAYVPTTQLGLLIQGVIDTDALRKDQSYGPANPLAHGDSKHDATVASLGQNGLVPVAELAPVPQGGADSKFLKGDQSWADPAQAAHAASHENGGGDEISLAGLSGKAADAQDPTAHKTDHENGGGDEISIAELSGRTADAQRPEVLTGRSSDITVVHNAPETTLFEYNIPAAWGNNIDRFDFVLHGHMNIAAGIAQTLELKWYLAGVAWLTLSVPITTLHNTDLVLEVRLFANSGVHHAAHMMLLRADPPAGGRAVMIDTMWNLAIGAADELWKLTAQFTNGAAGSLLHMEACNLCSLSAQLT